MQTETAKPMGRKLQIEICLISARGLRRTSSFWKLQWYAVAWIHPENKYCTKIDASGTGNPLWKTGFSATIDPSEVNLQELVLHVEVHSREPVFLKQSLFGSATVVLKEFLDKYSSDSEAERKPAVEEVGSFQIRKKKSDKPVGFVDVSIRISEKEESGMPSYLGPEEGFHLHDHLGGGTSASGSFQSTTPHPGPLPPYHPHHHQLFTARPNYPPTQAPLQPLVPPPPTNIGYGSYFAPPTTSSYINMPSSVDPPRHGVGLGPRFGMGVAAGGALAAGAMIYGDDLMSGFQIPHASVSVSTYPPF